MIQSPIPDPPRDGAMLLPETGRISNAADGTNPRSRREDEYSELENWRRGYAMEIEKFLKTTIKKTLEGKTNPLLI